MIGFPLDSVVSYDDDNIPVFDRAITSAPYRSLLKKLFSDGVMPNPSTNMQVLAYNGMSLTVSAGFAMCNGCMKLITEAETVTIAPASSLPRIDSVVLRLDDNLDVRSCEFAVLTGTASSSPVAPTLTRNETIWEIGLANVYVASGTSSISQSVITDTRYDSSRCGVVSSISEFDTTTLYNQIQADLADFQSINEAEFTAWFDAVKGQLSTDVAGNLQNEIDAEISNRESADNTLTSAVNAKAPISHASTDTTYGVGSGSSYGHLKLSDSVSSTSGTYGGYASTPSAVKSAYDLANTANTTANTANTTANTANATANALNKTSYTYVTSGNITAKFYKCGNVVNANVGGNSSTGTNVSITIPSGYEPYFQNFESENCFSFSDGTTYSTECQVSGRTTMYFVDSSTHTGTHASHHLLSWIVNGL